ncbi:hypothetical protein TH468_18170 [Thalassospira sp. MCCC 1A03138]|nr:hypothetical protein TH468_18170 [Thalassospira sp. MCCC 1A03138]
MLRWQRRAIDAGKDLPRTDFNDTLDIALAYFIWSHSLRDWIIKDGAITSAEIDNNLSRYPVWQIVRDVANRSKHLKLTQNPKDADWFVRREYDSFSIVLEGRERHHINLFFDGKKHRLTDVILESSEMWKEILLNQKMLG